MSQFVFQKLNEITTWVKTNSPLLGATKRKRSAEEPAPEMLSDDEPTTPKTDDSPAKKSKSESLEKHNEEENGVGENGKEREKIDTSDFEDAGSHGLIDELANNWYCYWDESYGNPSDPAKTYLFKPPLAVWKCGIVHSGAQFKDIGDKIDQDQDQDLSEDLKDLLDLKARVAGKKLGSENEYPFYPIIIQISESDATAEEILHSLGAHTEVVNAVDTTFSLKKHSEESDGGEPSSAVWDYSTIYEWFDHNPAKQMEFVTGVEKWNPVLTFKLKKGKSGNLIGLVSALILT